MVVSATVVVVVSAAVVVVVSVSDDGAVSSTVVLVSASDDGAVSSAVVVVSSGTVSDDGTSDGCVSEEAKLLPHLNQKRKKIPDSLL